MTSPCHDPPPAQPYDESTRPSYTENLCLALSCRQINAQVHRYLIWSVLILKTRFAITHNEMETTPTDLLSDGKHNYIYNE